MLLQQRLRIIVPTVSARTVFCVQTLIKQARQRNFRESVSYGLVQSIGWVKC